MTQPIVALDGPDTLDFMLWLAYGPSKQRWFKVGPRTFLRNPEEAAQILRRAAREEIKLFLDMKWADTRETVADAFRLAADLGVAAVSTSTQVQTDACLDTGIATVAVWQVHVLSDSEEDPYDLNYVRSPGVICPWSMARDYVRIRGSSPDLPREIVVPGVRLSGEPFDGHACGGYVCDVKGVADYVVLGRHVWAAQDPEAKLAEYRSALG